MGIWPSPALHVAQGPGALTQLSQQVLSPHAADPWTAGDAQGLWPVQGAAATKPFKGPALAPAPVCYFKKKSRMKKKKVSIFDETPTK